MENCKLVHTESSVDLSAWEKTVFMIIDRGRNW